MAVVIEIKLKGLLKKKITIPQIAKLKDLSYGVSNEHGVLDFDATGPNMILYNPKCIGRGIDISIEERKISLNLPFPTTPSDIYLFYELTEAICKKLKTNKVIREGEEVSIIEFDSYKKNDLETSLKILENITTEINSEESDIDTHFIFGAFNIIALGEKELAKIDHSLEKFETLLNELQHIDAFFPTPKFYKRNDGTVLGLYFIGEDIDTIVPTKPYTFVKLESVPENYYVFLPGNITIKYEDFINNVTKKANYDSRHFIVSLSKEKIAELTTKYKVDL